MGRELRRKQAKKEGKSLEREEVVEENQIKRYFIIILVLILVVTTIYLVSGLFITKEIKWFSKDDEKTSTDSTVNNSILASAIFNQSDEEYYVYFYDFNEEQKDSEITNLVNEKLTDNKVYKVNTSSALNSNYVAEESNKGAKTLAELKVVPHTLIKISGDTITEYYETDEIKTKLG